MFGYSVALVFVYVSVRGSIMFRFHSAEAVSVSFEPSSTRAVLLANDTELSVAPKTRRQQRKSEALVNGESPVVKSEQAMKSPPAGKRPHGVLLRVLPSSVFSHHLPSSSEFTSVIYVSGRMLCDARLEDLLPSDPNTILIGRVKRLDPPTDPEPASNPPSSDAPAVAKVLNPNEATKREDAKGEPSRAGKVRVIGLEIIPEGQTIIVGGVDGVQDWDVVRQVLSTGKQNNNRNSWPSRLTVSADSEVTKTALDTPSASPCVYPCTACPLAHADVLQQTSAIPACSCPGWCG